MRLKFELKSVKINAVCHIQLARHAEQLKGRYATGQLYGALYQDSAHITNIMPFPDADLMNTKQELQAMEKRHEDYVNNFSLDTATLGWYMVCYKNNFWDGLEALNYYEKYINTSFFLVYDYKAKQKGMNPYKAFRLSNKFVMEQKFSVNNLSATNLREDDPLEQITVYTEKDELFEAFMINHRKIFSQMRDTKRKKTTQKRLKERVEQYMETLDEHQEMIKAISQKKEREKEESSFSQYCQFKGLLLKSEKQEQSLKDYRNQIEKVTSLMHKS